MVKTSLIAKINRIDQQLDILMEEVKGVSGYAIGKINTAIEVRKEALAHLRRLSYKENPSWKEIQKKFKFRIAMQ